MNVLVSNEYRNMFGTLDIDVIKSISGVFEVNELINMFKNFYYQRMILDITALKDYKDISTIQKLSIGLDMSKVILVLDDSEDSSSSQYLSKLISMGIYNFTRNKEGILYLLDYPNSYRDVAHIHQLNDLTETVVERVETNTVIERTTILGIKNVTSHAGATTLIYMLKKQLQRNYSVVAIEIDKRDFVYFNDKDMVSTTAEQFPKELMKYNGVDVILVDLNQLADTSVCNEILYLIEPSMLKLNKLFFGNRNIFQQLKGQKIVLNKSLLSSKDILDFQYESKTNVFYNVPPLDERKDHQTILDSLLSKIGFSRQRVEEQDHEKGKILGLFKF